MASEKKKEKKKPMRSFDTNDLTLEEIFGTEQKERREKAPVSSKWIFSYIESADGSVEIPDELYKDKAFTVIWNSATKDGWSIQFQRGILGIASYVNIKLVWDIETEDICAHLLGHTYEKTEISIEKSTAKQV